MRACSSLRTSPEKCGPRTGSNMRLSLPHVYGAVVGFDSKRGGSCDDSSTTCLLFRGLGSSCARPW